MPPLEEEIDSDNEESETELSKLKREQEKLKKEIAELSKKANKSKVGEETQLSFWMAGENSLMRRELKISGTIGQPGETNKLNFISLIHQIEGALSKGYSEIKVREAVIQSISPGMTLRSFLECTPDLPLPKLRKILRSHYREKSSTELYKNLSTLTQVPNEDAQAFLFRALELRQRVMFTSKEADSKIKYDPEMIQSLFLYSIETGLRDESIGSKLRPFLQSLNVSDEELIGEMNIIFSEEQEGDSKFGRRPPKIATGKIDQVTPPAQTDIL
eukprot:gene6741-7501_t